MRLTGISSAGVAAICAFVCLGNGLTLLAIGRTRSLRNKCNLLIAHLALVDMVTGLVTWPVLKYLAEDGNTLLSCLGAHAIVIALKDTSQFLLLFICVVMYIKIAYPLRYRHWLCAWRMHAITAATWLLGATIGALSFIWARFDDKEATVDMCFITVMPFPYWVGVINWFFVAVSVAILIMYVRIICIASRHLHHQQGSRSRHLPYASSRRLTVGGATSRRVSFAAHDTPLPPRPASPSLAAVADAQKQEGGGGDVAVVTGSGGAASDGVNARQSSSSESDRNSNYCEFNRNEMNHLRLTHAQLALNESRSDGHIEALYRCGNPDPQLMPTSIQGSSHTRPSVVKVKAKSSSMICVRSRSRPSTPKGSHKVPCRPTPTVTAIAVTRDELSTTIAAPQPSRLAVDTVESGRRVSRVSRVKVSCSGVKVTSHPRLSGHNHELQLTITMLVTYLAFIICWLPLEIAVYCTSLGLITNASQSAFVEFSLTLSLANSGVNVVIYSWRYLAFRKAIRNLFTCRNRQVNRLTCNYASSSYA